MSRLRIVFALILVAGLLGIAWWAPSPPQREEIRVADVRKRTARSLERVGALHFVPDSSGRPQYSTKPATTASPSTTGHQPQDGDEERIVCSLWAAEEDLRDPETGILTNPFERGSEWERPVFVSLFVRGRLVGESMAHLRVHGGTSRRRANSFRLTFHPGMQPVYGATGDPDEIPSSSTWVLRADRYHALGGPIASDLVGIAGGFSARFLPIAVDLNGERICPLHFAAARLDDLFGAAHLGHVDFAWTRQKINEGDARLDVYERLIRRVDTRRKVDLRILQQLVDVKPLVVWVMSVIFMEVQDSNQGLALYDRSPGSDGWRWIGWDLDHSLKPWNPSSPKGRNVIESLSRYRHDARLRLFVRAMEDDPEFRQLFLAVSTETVNHKWTHKVIDELIARYQGIAETYYSEHRLRRVQRVVEGYREYLSARPPLFFAELRDGFQLPEPFQCRVQSPEVSDLCIDGYAAGEADYRGWYYPGQELHLSRASGAHFTVMEQSRILARKVTSCRVEVHSALDLTVVVEP